MKEKFKILEHKFILYSLILYINHEHKFIEEEEEKVEQVYYCFNGSGITLCLNLKLSKFLVDTLSIWYIVTSS